MTTKEIAEAAGVSADTVQRKIKELFPDRVQERRRTELNQSQAIRVMAELRKKDFMSLPQNAVDAPQNAEDRITRLETLVAAQIGMDKDFSARDLQDLMSIPLLEREGMVYKLYFNKLNPIGAALAESAPKIAGLIHWTISRVKACYRRLSL